MIDLAGPLGEEAAFKIRTEAFLLNVHAFDEVLVRPLSPLSEDSTHLGTSHGVHCIASDSALSSLEGTVRSPGSEVSLIISSMYSLVEESIHELLLLALHVLQLSDVLALSSDAVVGFVKLILRSRSVLIKVLLILLHVHGSHVGVLIHKVALEVFEQSLIILFESNLSAVCLLEGNFLTDNSNSSLLGHY